MGGGTGMGTGMSEIGSSMTLGLGQGPGLGQGQASVTFADANGESQIMHGKAAATATAGNKEPSMDHTSGSVHTDSQIKASVITTGSNATVKGHPHDDPNQTSFSFNIRKQSCKIEDFEFNRFDIDLGEPMSPKVDLAGEVEGLKPTAIVSD